MILTGGPKSSVFWSECCQEEALSTLVELEHRDLKAHPYSDRHTSSNKATPPLIKPHLLIVPLSMAKHFQTTTHTNTKWSFKNVLIFMYMCVCLRACTYTMWTQGPTEIRRVFRSPRTEVKIAVSCHVVAGKPTQVLCKSTKPSLQPQRKWILSLNFNLFKYSGWFGTYFFIAKAGLGLMAICLPQPPGC